MIFFLKLTHANDESILWHTSFGDLNFMYLQQLSKKGMITSLCNIKFIDGVCQGCILGNHPEEEFEKGKKRRELSILELIHSDVLGPFPHPSMIKVRYVLTFIFD
jgi:hypothetical protein